MADDWQLGKTLSDRLQHMLSHQLMCDVTFRVGSTKAPIKSHKFMLASACTKPGKCAVLYLCPRSTNVPILLFSIFDFRIAHSVVFSTFYFVLLEIKWNRYIIYICVYLLTLKCR
jgi:hypothetical protein